MNKINVLISGSNRGLGKSLVTIFNKNNKYNIIKCSRKKISGYEILRLENDIFIKKDIINIIKKYKKIDILINNAGVNSKKNFLDDNIKLTKKIFQVNFFSHYLICKMVLKNMLKYKSGLIINISSGSGLKSENMQGAIDYCLSKSLINNMVFKLANELPTFIKIIAICPGWIKTRMGGKNAPIEPNDSAKQIYRLIDKGNLKSGKFYRNGKILSL